MAKLTRMIALAVDSESTQGTPATIDATDFLLVEDPEIKQVADILPRNYYRVSLDPVAHIAGMKYAEITFKTEIKGSLASNTAYAPLHALLKACGMSSTGGTGATDWTFNFISTAVSNHLGPATACTIQFFRDGLKHVMQGSVGSCKITAKAGAIAMCEFSMKGQYTAVADQASWPTSPTMTYSSVIPPIVESATLKIDNTGTFVAESVEFDFGNDIQMIPDVNSSGGLKGFMIVGREPKAKVNPEAVTVATYDFFGKFMAGTSLNSGSVGLQIVIGSVAMNKWTITSPHCQIEDIAYADRNGILALDVSLGLRQTSGDDSLTILVDNA